ncbi:hypothetical protein [Burkholderia sp. Bp8963]|uniref:hypothetical protein n=1 Tax=Burkholderia sp. Bp8963 TaxID=2184547 RepID=UPI000F5984DB|nr:hypothetical protein [Burkholderia sp. Bp8963]
MIKTFVVCTVLCAAVAALVRFHGPIVNGAGPNHTPLTTAKLAGARAVAVDESNTAQSLNDDRFTRQASAAKTSTESSTVALGAAKAGWADLFNH